MKAFSLPNEFHAPGYYAVLAQRWEQQFCLAHQLPYHPPEPLPQSTALRNCPRCAAIGYHSPVYQWAWLTQCPIHGVPLTAACPDCQAPWPSVVELLERHCPGCGWPVPRHQLSSLEAFSTPWSAIDSVRAVHRDYRSVAKARLTASENSPHALDEHQSIAIEHRDFASIYVHQFPYSHRQLLAQQAWLQPVTCFRFALSAKRVDGKSGGRQAFDHLASGWRRQVETQILKAIERDRQGPLVIPRFYAMEFEGLAADTDCVLMALTYWRKLVKTRPDHAPPRSRYFDQGAGSYPLIPVPMARVALATEDDQDSGFLCAVQFPIPLRLMRRMYYLDLWWCFQSLCIYFEVLKAQRDAIHSNTLYRTLPLWAWPGRSYNEAMGIFIHGQHQVELVIPTARLSWSLK